MSKPVVKQSDALFRAVDIGRADSDLVSACKKGDNDAWDRLIERYQRLIFAIPRRAGLSEEQSADIFQEVFLALFEKLDHIEQPEKLRSWLVTTAKFKTWGVIRGTKNLYTPANEEEMELEMANIKDGTPLADEMLIELEQQHLIRTALNKLEEQCIKILSMIYLHEPAASYVEVASAIGVGSTSISPMRARCLKKLEKLLNK